MNPTSKEASSTASLPSPHDTSSSGGLLEHHSGVDTPSAEAASTIRSPSTRRSELIASLSAIVNNSVQLPEEDLRALEGVLARLKWMKKRTGDPQTEGRKAQCLTLSKVNQSHLSDLSVSTKQTLTQQPFEVKMTKGSLTQIHHDTMSKIEGYEYKNLLRKLDMLYRQLNDMPDFASRVIRNEWKLTLMGISDSMGLAAQLFPDLDISQSSDGAVVVCGEHTDTRLTGTFDSFFWTIQISEATRLEGLGKGIHTVENFEMILDYRKEISNSSNNLLLWCDVHINEDLMPHLPRAVATDVVALTVEGSVSAIPFILANGKEWIFGVVSIEPGGKKRCFHTAVLTFDGKHITLATALYVWANRPATELIDILAN